MKVERAILDQGSLVPEASTTVRGSRAVTIALGLVWILSCGQSRLQPIAPLWAEGRAATDYALIAVESIGEALTAVDSRGRVLRSDDQGLTWNLLVSSLPGDSSLQAAYIQDEAHIWGASGYYTDHYLTPLAVFRLDPREGRWEELFRLRDHKLRVHSIRFWSDREGTILAWSPDGWGACLETQDCGLHWSKLAWPIAEGVFLDRERIWGLGASALHYTEDSGGHWRVATQDIGGRLGASTIYGVAFRDAKHGWVFGSKKKFEATSPHLLAATHDAGQTWKDMRVGWQSSNAQGGWVWQAEFIDESRGWIVLQEVTRSDRTAEEKPALPDNLEQSEFFILATEDGGATWKREWSGKRRITRLAAFPSGVLVAIGEHGMILRRHLGRKGCS